MSRKKKLPDDVKRICLALVQAIFQSCVDGRKHPFERLGVAGMERSCFYERRMKFLVDIAKYMELVR